MKKGANTFPFHNHPPYSESNEGLFLFFSPSLNWIKEKSVATLAIRNICDKTQNNPKSVLPPYYSSTGSNMLESLLINVSTIVEWYLHAYCIDKTSQSC